jgi:hypothetical protein
MANPTRCPFTRLSELEQPPTITPRLISLRTTFEITVDFPTPGEPVTSRIALMRQSPRRSHTISYFREAGRRA